MKVRLWRVCKNVMSDARESHTLIPEGVVLPASNLVVCLKLGLWFV